MMITEEELSLTRECIGIALAKGASACRATLNKSCEDYVATLDGEVDRITRCEDRSLTIAIFADGRYGSFSTNKLAELDEFIERAIGIVKMLAPDACRVLPDPARCASNARTGLEAGIFDPEVASLDGQARTRLALSAAVTGAKPGDGFKLVSEEGELSSSLYDTFLADSNGVECRQTETSFDYWVEVTVEDAGGDKYSGYWWTSTPFLKDFNPSECGSKALARALAQAGSSPAPSGKYNMVIDTEVASKVVSPILSALNGYSLQQDNSFLKGSLGKTVFPEGLSIKDMPLIPGQSGSRLFDSEGVAAQERYIIEKGTVREYFLNSYMAGKMEMGPTLEDAMRPMLEAWPRKGAGQADLLELCGDGILVTDFNGGNCNSATGDFSYGIEGFLFKDGKIASPVSEMLVTGNFLTLWKGFLASGDDARPCMSKLIPTLAFSNVDFSG